VEFSYNSLLLRWTELNKDSPATSNYQSPHCQWVEVDRAACNKIDKFNRHNIRESIDCLHSEHMISPSNCHRHHFYRFALQLVTTWCVLFAWLQSSLSSRTIDFIFVTKWSVKRGSGWFAFSYPRLSHFTHTLHLATRTIYRSSPIWQRQIQCGLSGRFDGLRILHAGPMQKSNLHVMKSEIRRSRLQN